MLDLFRTLVLFLAIVAPGDVHCNRPIAQATLCTVTFVNPAYTETVTPAHPGRLRALIEIKQLERQK